MPEATVAGLKREPPPDLGLTEFVPLGSEDKIRLGVKIVRTMIARPTRTGKMPTDVDCLKFIAMCRSKRLNPFEGDAFMIGYDSASGAAEFSLITAHQTFLKRAENNPDYDGMKSGVIVRNGDGNVVDLEGDFYTDDQELVGGWAQVTFKARKIPTLRRLKLKTFARNTEIWRNNPAGMIVKCAEADALRSSFPTLLGGLYTREERIAGAGPDLDLLPAAGDLKAGETQQAVPKAEENPDGDLGPVSGPAQPAAETETGNAPAKSAHDTPLAEKVSAAGFNFDQFMLVALARKLVTKEEVDERWVGFGDIPNERAKRLERALPALIVDMQERVKSGNLL